MPNIEWLELVIENRESRDRAHRFDVISGPTADDDTRMSIDQYRALPEEVRRDPRVKQVLIDKLMPRENRLPTQWYFGNNAVVERSLRIARREQIWHEGD